MQFYSQFVRKHDHFGIFISLYNNSHRPIDSTRRVRSAHLTTLLVGCAVRTLLLYKLLNRQFVRKHDHFGIFISLYNNSHRPIDSTRRVRSAHLTTLLVGCAVRTLLLYS